ncbi:hypothetical protein CU098_005033, partial [Rhizopus stolonifer]
VGMSENPSAFKSFDKSHVKETVQDVDEFTFEDLCFAAKKGDLKKIENLVNNFNAPINIVDGWQCSPLYWACLCGHYAVVKFLLENGAQCDKNTFQGERCLYGALNTEIRDLLLSYKLTKAVDENQPYLLFLSNLFDSHNHHDLTFSIPLNDTSHEFHVHRFILTARSTYFADNLVSRWSGQHHVKFQKNLIHPNSWQSILRYLYTGYVNYKLEKDVLENMLFATKHLKLNHLHHLLSEGNEDDAQRSQSKQEIKLLRNQLQDLFDNLILISIEAVYVDLWCKIASWVPSAPARDPESLFTDVAIRLYNNVIFPCHRAYLCRSEFFNTLLSGSFGEQDVQEIRYEQTRLRLPVIELLDIEPDVFYYVLQFLYTDRCDVLAQDAYDVLLVADMLLIDRLKAVAAIAITNQAEPVVDIYELIQTAIDLEVERVEQYCIEYFADRIDDYIKQPEFLQLIKNSAQTIKKREETGTQLFIEKRILYDTHVPISTAERTILTVGSAFAALNNPLRGDMVATLGETTGNVFLSRMRDGMLQSEEGRQILRERPMISTSTIDFDRLKKECSPDSFGMAYISWLEAQGVTPDTRSDVRFVDCEELAYVMNRYRQIHDFFHTLTGLGVTVEEEIALKWFEWVQTGLPMTMLSSLFGPLRLTWPEKARLYGHYVPWALQCGASCTPLMNVYFEHHFHTPLDEFRNKLGIILPQIN